MASDSVSQSTHLDYALTNTLIDLSCKKGNSSSLHRDVPPNWDLYLIADSDIDPQSLQVRCDAASLGVPCTNCVAFQIECRIPNPKRKKTQGSGSQTNKDSDRYGNAPTCARGF